MSLNNERGEKKEKSCDKRAEPTDVNQELARLELIRLRQQLRRGGGGAAAATARSMGRGSMAGG